MIEKCFNCISENLRIASKMFVAYIDQLEPGDHVSFKRPLYSHHAIVEDVDYEKGNVTVIEYGTDPREVASKTSKNVVFSAPWKAKISRKTLKFLDENFNKVIHKVSLSAREVIRRARSRIGEEAYNVFENNCEHFANWCKEGDSKSEQAWKLGLGVGGLIALGAVIGAAISSDEDNNKKS